MALGALWWFYLRPGSPRPEEWQGYAEADFVKVGPTQQGLVTAIHVQRGDHVVKGAPLFEQDDANERHFVDQAGRQLAQAQEMLANLNNPAKPTEIEQAEANLRDATAARDKTFTDLQRNQTLLKSGSATAQIVDQERADLNSAEAKIAAYEAAVAQAKAPMGRAGEIKAQSAAVDAAEAALAMARWRLEQRSRRSRRSPAWSPTCWRSRARRSQPARRSSRSCRRRTSLSASSCPSRRWRTCTSATRWRFCAIIVRPTSGRPSPSSRRRPNITPPVIYSEIDAQQIRVSCRSATAAERRDLASIRASR